MLFLPSLLLAGLFAFRQGADDAPCARRALVAAPDGDRALARFDAPEAPRRRR